MLVCKYLLLKIWKDKEKKSLKNIIQLILPECSFNIVSELHQGFNQRGHLTNIGIPITGIIWSYGRPIFIIGLYWIDPLESQRWCVRVFWILTAQSVGDNVRILLSVPQCQRGCFHVHLLLCVRVYMKGCGCECGTSTWCLQVVQIYVHIKDINWPL